MTESNLTITRMQHDDFVEYLQRTLTTGYVSRSKVVEVLHKVEEPAIINEVLYIPKSYGRTLDEEAAHINGLIVSYVVRKL